MKPSNGKNRDLHRVGNRRKADRRLTACSVVLCGLLAATIPGMARAEDPFAANIRPTEALSPEQEQKSFHLPPGFEIQLFAAEPDLQKPLNLAFDTKGRLWVSGSTEYPFPAPLDKPGRDTIKILEDTNADGRADKITTFADGLNIPIGLYPYRNGVIVYSIPYIYFFEDVDGDDHVDKRHVLYGPFDYTRDTHGMNNAFRRGFDGWIYACHGWANQDTVAGTDGHSIRMEGGNTFRMRMDGSRVESFTFGQVNPFGMTIDARGDLFSADCHTKPIMLLLRGGYFESFGKPNDGLGVVPTVMNHLHGSTAIAGTTVYAADNFPPEYRGNMFAGNVMTSRVNRDSITSVGSSVRANEEPDFVVSDDPWFRPVDLQIGPDGAMYVADFYNRIIGHYEVPLSHPGRDRERGRIWRIVYTGDDKNTPRHARAPNFSTATAEQLIAALSSANLSVRRLATDELSDRVGESATELLQSAARENTSAAARVHCLWNLFRIGKLSPADMMASASDADPLVRTHVQRILSETTTLTSEMSRAAIVGLLDTDAFVRRAAVDALGQHPEVDAVDPLIDLLLSTRPDDVHLLHMARIALRNQCRAPGRLAQVQTANPERQGAVADVVLGLESPEAGTFLFNYLQQGSMDQPKVPGLLEHAARQLPTDAVDSLVALARGKATDDLDLSLSLFTSIDQGLKRRALQSPPSMTDWGTTLAGQLLASVKAEASVSWHALSAGAQGATLWSREERMSADGPRDVFASSLPLGEQYTGVLRSEPFALPRALSFFVCGHLGPPQQPPILQNLVRLKLESTNEVVAEALAPRDDIAHRVDWDLQKYIGEKGYLEIVDGVDGASFAWIAVGRFKPAVVRVPETTTDVAARRVQVAAQLAGRLKLTSLREPLKSLTVDESLAAKTRGAAALGLIAIQPQVELAVLCDHVAHESVSVPLRNRMCQAIAAENIEEARTVLTELVRTAPERLQTSLALKMAEQTISAESLLKLLEQGIAPPHLLHNATLVQKLQLAAPENVAGRIQALIASLPPRNEQILQLIAQRQRDFSSSKASTEHGREIFVKHCAACHQVRGQGAIIGPQLDGIGNRGAERIIEDVLDPHRNVDPGFRTTVYALEDGRVLSGLFRRNEGGMTIIADNAGKETAFPTDEIAEQRKTTTSLMPDNFGTALPPGDFNDVTAFLAADRTKLDPSQTSKAEISK